MSLFYFPFIYFLTSLYGQKTVSLSWDRREEEERQGGGARGHFWKVEKPFGCNGLEYNNFVIYIYIFTK